MANTDIPYHHGNLRQALLDSAETVLVRDGINALSLRAVAREAGVSHTAPYRHFKDKAALLRGIAQRGFEALETAMAATISADGDPRSNLIEAGVAYVELALRHPQRMRLMFSASLEGVTEDTEFARTSRAALAGLENLIGEGVRQGLFVGDPALLALTAWSSVHGFASLVLEQHALVDAPAQARLAAARAIAANVVRGMERRPAPLD